MSPIAASVRSFAAGEVLFREEERGREMYVVQSGKVRVTRSVEGRDHEVAVLEKGDFFGELAVLNGKPRNATVTAVDAASCVVIDEAALEQLVIDKPEIALALIRKLARRLDGADAMVDILLHRDPKARVLQALKHKVERDGLEDFAELSAHTLAREVGATFDEVAAVVRRLRRVNVADIDDAGVVTLLDRERFVEFIDYLQNPHAAANRTASE